jgi:hypothetical protein
MDMIRKWFGLVCDVMVCEVRCVGCGMWCVMCVVHVGGWVIVWCDSV